MNATNGCYGRPSSVCPADDPEAFFTAMTVIFASIPYDIET
jgi:hypothetical protein